MQQRNEIRSAQELMTLISHEQHLIVSRLHSDDVAGIHQFIMEHATKSRKYYLELIVLMGREQAGSMWEGILHRVYGLNEYEVIFHRERVTPLETRRTSGLHNDETNASGSSFGLSSGGSLSDPESW